MRTSNLGLGKSAVTLEVTDKLCSNPDCVISVVAQCSVECCRQVLQLRVQKYCEKTIFSIICVVWFLCFNALVILSYKIFYFFML